jgi:hypothetical protein
MLLYLSADGLPKREDSTTAGMFDGLVVHATLRSTKTNRYPFGSL